MYLSEGIDDAERIREAIYRGENVSSIYCICIRNGGNNLMEIIQTKEIIKKKYFCGKYFIIGLADGKLESFQLVKEILEDYYTANKNLKGFKESFWQGGYAWAL